MKGSDSKKPKDDEGDKSNKEKSHSRRSLGSSNIKDHEKEHNKQKDENTEREKKEDKDKTDRTSRVKKEGPHHQSPKKGLGDSKGAK